MFSPTLPAGTGMRLLRASDAAALASAYQDNREHLAPWEPHRAEAFFTESGQAALIEGKLAALAAGTELPWVLTAGSEVIGMITLTGIVRGPFLNGHVGYWVAAHAQGRGVCSAALAAVLVHAREDVGLHRVQAAVLPANRASQAVLDRAGFTLIGNAPSYLRIAGAWQDHLLYQRIIS